MAFLATVSMTVATIVHSSDYGFSGIRLYLHSSCGRFGARGDERSTGKLLTIVALRRGWHNGFAGKSDRRLMDKSCDVILRKDLATIWARDSHVFFLRIRAPCFQIWSSFFAFLQLLLNRSIRFDQAVGSSQDIRFLQIGLRCYTKRLEVFGGILNSVQISVGRVDQVLRI